MTGTSTRGWVWRAACPLALALMMALASACGGSARRAAQPDQAQSGVSSEKADELLVVDCLLPGQIRKLGQSMTYLTPRRPIKTSARECEIRGGEYVAYDRSNYATALKVWLPMAQQGDPVAQTYVGEIYEKGLGIQPDYLVAAEWYRRAAEKGYSRAQINLGFLYENGRGVERDLVKALNWYRKASGLGEAVAIDIGEGSIADVGQVAQLREESERQRRQTESLRAEIEQTRAQRDRARQELERRTLQVDAERLTLDQARQELERRRKEAEAARGQEGPELGQLAEQLRRRAAELDRQRQENVRLQVKAQRAGKELDARVAQAEAARRELERARQELAKRKQDSGAARSQDVAELKRLEEKLTRREADLARQNQENARLAAEAARYRQELERRAVEAEAGRKQLQITAAELEKRNKEAEAARARDAAQVKKLEEQLTQRQAEVERQRQEVARLKGEADRYRNQVARLEADQRQKAAEASQLLRPMAALALAGPTIEIIEPPLVTTRGTTPTVKTRSGDSRVLVGRVTAPAGLRALIVNGRPETPDRNGLFRVQMPVLRSRTSVQAVAEDAQGKRAAVEFLFLPEEPSVADAPRAPSAELRTEAVPPVDFGSYYALVIGSNNYRFLPRLDTAVDDAKAVADLLSQRYRFKTTTLVNATRYDILSALNRLREKLTEKDNLLIYYAGHGELDKANQRGHWLPVDAEPDSTANWISNVQVTDVLNAMAAKHVLVVADSCYSGTLTRSSLARLETGMTDETWVNWLKAMTRARARTVLTSGGLQPVLDAGGGGHSVFAKAFLEVLAANGGVLEGQRLYREVSARVVVAASSLKFDQRPWYGPIQHAGHESGEFFLIARASSSALSGASVPAKDRRKRSGEERSQ